MSTRHKNLTRTAAAITEQVICPGRCILYGIYPELTTTGTLTVRDSATAAASAPVHVCAIGLPQAGKMFYAGAQFLNGLTIQQSVATDQCAIVWEAVP